MAVPRFPQPRPMLLPIIFPTGDLHGEQGERDPWLPENPRSLPGESAPAEETENLDILYDVVIFTVYLIFVHFYDFHVSILVVENGFQFISHTNFKRIANEFCK